MACARCHDHKYDPIPTKDYYALYSILSNIREPKELPLLGKPLELSRKQAVYPERLKRIQNLYKEYRTRRHVEMVAFFKTQVADYMVAARDAEGLSAPEIEELVRDRQLNQHVLARWQKYLRESKKADEPVFRLWHAAAGDSGEGVRDEVPDGTQNHQGYLSNRSRDGCGRRWPRCGIWRERTRRPWRDMIDASLSAIPTLIDSVPLFADQSRPCDVPLEEFDLICTEGDRNNMRSIRVRYNAMLAQAAYDGASPRAMAVEDLPHSVPAHVFLRGNPNNPGPLAPPRFLSLSGRQRRKRVPPKWSGRLELAHAIIDPTNPLTARVIVNRVWMHHFGFGLVRTPSNFGFRGDPPSHPEVLDYLAVKFVESGWSLKKLHRLIMTSAAFRQASAENEAARQVDPENQLLWRMNRRRLEIESLRDSLLAASGRLDLTEGGVPFPLTAQPSVPRRSVYGFIGRGRIPNLLSAFDFASPDQHAPMRYVTTVPQQALFFLNSPFVAEQARALAARPEVAAAPTASEKIRNLYRVIFSSRTREVRDGGQPEVRFARCRSGS